METIADRVRVMDDETLAYFLFRIMWERDQYHFRKMAAAGLTVTAVSIPAEAIRKNLEYLRQPAAALGTDFDDLEDDDG